MAGAIHGAAHHLARGDPGPDARSVATGQQQSLANANDVDFGRGVRLLREEQQFVLPRPPQAVIPAEAQHAGVLDQPRPPHDG